jgi:hypothetical protein
MPIRNKFFHGRLLTAEDLAQEQHYFRGKLKLHNRSLHGFGIVSGLDVSARRDKVVIGAGLALDCEGNEIIVSEPAESPLPDPQAEGTKLFVTLHYAERERDHTSSAAGANLFLRIEETFGITLVKENATQRHRHVNGRWLACGNCHGLTIARLKCVSGVWRLDRRLARPFVK